MRTKILYEDKDILVIYKPAGLATQTARIGEQDVVSELKNYLKGGYVGVIHRLDQPVEGLLVFGKTRTATAGLTSQLQGMEDGCGLSKQYYAVFCGEPLNKSGMLVDKICKTNGNRAIISEDSGNDMQFKEARLSYLVKETVRRDDILLSLADITIYTGRFHQIRCQMAHAGMALLGDSKYADPDTRDMSARLGVRNVALCAYRLEFVHPVTKKRMEFCENPGGGIFSLFSLG